MGDYGARIKAAREAADLTQEQLGKMIGVTGVTITRYEKNQRDPRLKQLRSIADALGVPVGYLMGCMDDNGVIDQGLVAIELSRIIGIDRAIVYDAISEVGPDDLFSETGIKTIKETAQSLSLKRAITQTMEASKKAAEKSKFSIAKYLEEIESYEYKASVEIRKFLGRLNEEGQQEAVKRVAELTEIPRYQKQPEPMSQEEKK